MAVHVRRIAAALGSAAAVALALLIALSGDAGREPRCPIGTESRQDRAVNAAAEARAERRREATGARQPGAAAEEREREAAEHGGTTSRAGRDGPRCLLVPPEGAEEILAANSSLDARLSAPATRSPRGAHARALRQKARLAASSIPGSGGKWTPLGHGPLLDNEPGFTEVGFGKTGLAGRITDFAWNPRDKVVYASFGSGGLWRSATMGKSWHPIGDSLPTQQMGSVGWSPARGGTILALTGDNSFSGFTFAGLGLYWSRDEGQTWHKAIGVPDDALGFKVAVDPGRPEIVYAATGFGLFRSTDAGETFTDVKLPTGECAGVVAAGDCFFANVVTDVVVRGADTFGNAGGAVMAAVGFRAGTKPNYRGKPRRRTTASTSPRRARRARSRGSPRRPADTGWASRRRFRRIGSAASSLRSPPGPTRTTTSSTRRSRTPTSSTTTASKGIDVPEFQDPVLGVNPLAKRTVLNGIYSRVDFGRTWTLMSNGDALDLPGKNSALFGVDTAIGYGPGINAWYDETIAVDPTRHVSGIPTRLSFGLEEVWQNRHHATCPRSGRRTSSSHRPLLRRVHLPFGIVPGDTGCPTNTPTTPTTSTHPDQHAQIWIPDGEGGVTLFAGDDGGVFTQHVAAGEELDNDEVGVGRERRVPHAAPVRRGHGQGRHGLRRVAGQRLRADRQGRPRDPLAGWRRLLRGSASRTTPRSRTARSPTASCTARPTAAAPSR